ncbi:MAG TPA: alpha-amylase family glycosyl hydrolase [Ferruginibacter sp.]|nr:alpha-amylase family glycosyl hydrolase [Ferruginibacter sp.]
MFKNRFSYLITAILIVAIFSCNTTERSINKDDTVWNKQTNIYEVNLRQYTASGSFADFAKSLPRLKDMGVEILWFMPITPIGIKGRKMSETDLGSYYAVRNYKAVNEEFGTMDDWKKLVKTAHDLDFKVIIDWVANHSALDNPWVKTHPDFYTKDSTGKLLSPFNWTDVYKLNYKNNVLRDSMIAAMKYWINETGIDGFRCDVAEEVPQDFWKQCIDSLRKVKNVFMLAEGEKPWLHDAGFNTTYTWQNMHLMKELYAGEKSLTYFDSVLNHNISIYPKDASRLYFTSNHDENSWNGTEYEKYGDAAKAFAVFTQTIFQSIPLIYSGQEEPNKKRLQFFVKDTIQWKQYALVPFYKTLLALRKSNPALAYDAAYKKLKTSNDKSVFAFLRQKENHKVMVVLNFSNQPQKFSINDSTINGEPENIFLGKPEKVTSTEFFSLEPWGYVVYDYK